MAKTNTITFVSGKSGTGKSWIAGWLAEQSSKPRVVLDPKNEHVDLALHRLVVTRQLVGKTGGDLYPAFRQLLRTHKSVRVTRSGLTMSMYRDAVNDLARAVHERGNLLWFADEYHQAAPNKEGAPEWVEILHTDARTKQIDIITSTQRPALTDTTIVSQANRRLTGQLTDKNDLARVRAFFQPHDGRKAEDVIRNLKPREFLWYNDTTGDQTIVHSSGLTRRVRHHG